MTDRPIRLIFDTSTVLAYVRGSFAVVEALGEVADEGAVVAVPVACLAEAQPLAVDGEGLRDLAEHPSVTVLDAAAEEWPGLGGMCALVEGFAAASAALAALDEGCWVLTSDPGRYAEVNSGDLVIPIDD